jgi:hypothetical protein
MTGRPCKPDADLKGLWRMLLGTPFPACGIAEDDDAPNRDGVTSARGQIKGPAPSGKAVATKY